MSKISKGFTHYIGSIVMGFIFLCIGIFMISQQQARKSWPTTTGVVQYRNIVKHNNQASADVEYYVNGKYYSHPVTFSKYGEVPGNGGNIEVVYNPNNPSNAYTKGSQDFSSFPLLFIPAGLGLIVLPFILRRKV